MSVEVVQGYARGGRRRGVTIAEGVAVTGIEVAGGRVKAVTTQDGRRLACDYLVNGHVVHEDARWFLGLKGMLLPGQGVGIEEVAPGSPAAAVGLQPGMVITRCNGIDMLDEAALAQAIGTSGGALQMDLLLAEGTPATCVVVMQRVTSVSF